MGLKKLKYILMTKDTKDKSHLTKGGPGDKYLGDGKVDTSQWFTHSHMLPWKGGEFEKKVKDQKMFFCSAPFQMLYTNTRGRYAPCSWAELNNEHLAPRIHDVSVKDWFENNENLNKLRAEMLDENSDLKLANEWCRTCIKQEKEYGRSRRQAALKIQTNDSLIWPELKKSIRRYQQDMKGHIKDRCFEVQIKVYGNKCNLDCFMCHPFDSTKRLETMRHKELDGQTIFSPHVQEYARSKRSFDLDKDSLETISDQIVDIAPYIYAMKLIGGEPLVMKPYYKLLEKLVEKAPDDCQKMLLKFQTNMQTMNMDKMQVTDYIDKFGTFEFTVSLDSVGIYNNYIRRRSNWDEIVNNIKTVRQYPNVKININGAISFLSVLRFYELPEWYDNNINLFKGFDRESMINWSNIRSPAKLAANVLPDKLKQELIPKYEKWPDIQQVLREDNNGLDYKETINYLLTIDKRYKGTKWEYNLFDVFPELKEYY